MGKEWMLFVFLLLLSSAAIAQHRNLVRDFRFLKGSWTMNTSKGRIVESWKCNKDSGLDGISFSINNTGDSTLLETIKIYESGGSIYYEPTGKGAGNNSIVSFRLISAKKKIFIFENNNHDFPQRISHQRHTSNNLFAWIEGTINGNFKRINFPYKRENLN